MFSVNKYDFEYLKRKYCGAWKMIQQDARRNENIGDVGNKKLRSRRKRETGRRREM